MFNPVPKPEPRTKQSKPLRSKTRLKSKAKLKSNPDPIPDSVKDEVDARDHLLCQDCGRPVKREDRPYHHITFKSRLESTVRLWTGLLWKMVPTWFKKHSKENLVTLCVLCHMKPHRSKQERYRWEKWRDVRHEAL